MSLLDRLFSWTVDNSAAPARVQAAGPGGSAGLFKDMCDPAVAEFLRDGLAVSRYSGRTVTEQTALSNATFYRAVNLKASAVGMLPLNLYQRQANGDVRKADDHPTQRLLRVRPNDWQTPLNFKSYMQGRATLFGNAYAFKVPGARGVQALIPLDPKRVTVEQSEDFTLLYKYQPKKGVIRRYRQDEIFHLRAPWSSDGITGEGLLKVAAEALALADVTDEAAARLLKNGAYVGGVLEHPKTLGLETAQSLRQQFADRFTGPENAGRWVVVEEGMQVKPFGATGRDAEGLAQRQHQAEEVSRYTGVPRPLLMFDETSWGTGIQQLGLFLVTYCLLPWFVAWEETIAFSLLTEKERDQGFYAKFNEAALLRGSLAEQADFLQKALGGPGATGFMLPDEAREKMDMNPLSGGAGQQPGWQQPG